jgi:lysophospholipase L1-like esterase
MWIRVLLFLTAVASCIPSMAQEPPKAKRILFLGDSITYSGGYIASLEAASIAQYPDRKTEYLNLGLPSETVSGLSEPGHAGGAFPRPDLHERLERVLDQTQPDLVIACYGMNDGIYYPLGDDRFEAFRSGMTRLHDAVVQRGAQIIHLTPAYFDALPIRDRLLPAGRDEYRQPYEGYDDVLEAYAKWLLDQRDRGWQVYDVHGAMKQAVLEARKTNPTFTFASDGVHPNAAGQVVIAGPLAKAWGLRIQDDGSPDHAQGKKILALVAKRQDILKHAWLTKTKHVRPGIPEGLPIDVAQAQAGEIAKELATLVGKSR